MFLRPPQFFFHHAHRNPKVFGNLLSGQAIQPRGKQNCARARRQFRHYPFEFRDVGAALDNPQRIGRVIGDMKKSLHLTCAQASVLGPPLVQRDMKGGPEQIGPGIANLPERLRSIEAQISILERILRPVGRPQPTRQAKSELAVSINQECPQCRQGFLLFLTRPFLTWRVLVKNIRVAPSLIHVADHFRSPDNRWCRPKIGVARPS
ncbi:MAG: hypothetical protein JWP25_5054 [Bradyrhizobium sp.]|nr:hypothetical protein [Bradyrhizobium sp.]MEA2869460.1 hypothetical protein [Bradyrhizobium sp.]